MWAAIKDRRHPCVKLDFPAWLKSTYNSQVKLPQAIEADWQASGFISEPLSIHVFVLIFLFFCF